MANYPFKINIQFKDGVQKSHYTSSFATDAETSLSASVMVDKINLIPLGATYTQDSVAVAADGSGRIFTNSGFGANFVSASYTHPNTGSVIFTDTEDTDNDGLDFYTFWGTKVCSVLGLPEGIPIYTETFKLSDDSSNPSNYLSGDVIADGIAIKESFKMAPQGRMRSNLVWDHQFGEGFLQWVSGSASKLLFGYDNVADTYSLSAASAATFNISGVDLLVATNVSASNIFATGNISGSGNLEIAGNISGSSTSTGSFAKLEVGAAVITTTAYNALGAAFNIASRTTENEVATFLSFTGVNTAAASTTISGSIIKIKGDTTFTDDITVAGSVNDISMDGIIGRTAHHIGGFVGGYNNLGTNAAKSNPIYVIGSNYQPTDAALSNMYGIGYCKTDATFIATSDNAWGMYVAADGDARVWINASDGTGVTVRNSYFNAGPVNFGTSSQDPVCLPQVTIEQDTANYVLSLKNTYTGNDSADGLMLNYSVTSDLDSSAHFFQVRDGDADIQFELRGNNAGGYTIGTSFTAGHDTSCVDDDDLLPGMIIESTGQVWYKPSGSFDTALPFTQLSNSNGSSTVFGVVGGWPLKYDATGSITNVDEGHEHYTKNGYYLKPSFTKYGKNAPTGSGNRQLNTMSIGEGVMWVTNHNDEITNGDYIESSVIKGYGRKQDDDILRSKTVAKCTEAINWSEVTASIQYSGSAYKKYLTAVTFHCG